MQVIFEKPPNYDAIARVFPIAGKPVFFAYGDKLYAPHRPKVIGPNYMVHESAHGVRQVAMGVEPWWAEYLINKEFRLAEEVIGHAAEYLELCRMHPERRMRRAHLVILAEKMAAPMYGGMVSKARAKTLIADAAEALQGQADGGS